MKSNDINTNKTLRTEITVQIPLAKGATKFHIKNTLFHYLVKKMNANIWVFNDVFGHPTDIQLGDEDV